MSKTIDYYLTLTSLWTYYGSARIEELAQAHGAKIRVERVTPAFVIYAAGSIELVGGLLVVIGLFTRWSAFVCSGLMAAAYWMAHGTKAFLPILNHGELAVIYCFVFLFISAHGAGIWSVDGSRGDG